MNRNIRKTNIFIIASIVIVYTLLIVTVCFNLALSYANKESSRDTKDSISSVINNFDQQIENVMRATHGIISKNSITQYLRGRDSSYTYFSDIYSDLVDSYSYLDKNNISIGITKIYDELVVSNDGYFSLNDYFNHISASEVSIHDINNWEDNHFYMLPLDDTMQNEQFVFVRKFKKFGQPLLTIFTFPVDRFTDYLSDSSINLFLNINGELITLKLNDALSEIESRQLNEMIYKGGKLSSHNNWTSYQQTSKILPDISVIQATTTLNVFKYIMPFLRKIIFLFLGLLILGYIITLFSSRKIYYPINQVLTKLKLRSDSENFSSSPIINELSFIESSIDELYEINSSLNQISNATLKFRQREFFTSLIKMHSLPHNMDEKINELELTAYEEKNLLVICSFEDFDFYMEKMMLEEITQIRSKLIDTLLKDSYILDFVVWPIDDQTFSIVIANTDFLSVSSTLDALINNSREHLSLAITVNTYAEFDSFENFTQTYNQSLQTIKNSKISHNLAYSLNDEIQLINAILQNDRKTAEKIAYQVLNEIILENRSKATIEIASTRFILINTLSRILSQYDYTFSEFYSENQLLFKNMSSNNPKILFKTFKDIFSKIFDDFIYEVDKVTDSTTVNIIKYIEENALQDFTLANVSEEFKLTEAYISRLLKKNANINFKKYITAIKIEAAKDLLTTTDMKVSSISQEVGFTNVSTFIRSFRNETGITPGEYRKQQATNQI